MTEEGKDGMTEGLVLPGWWCACGTFNGSAKEERTTCRVCDAPRAPELEEAPYVCPGCYAVGGERCAPGCIDAEIAEEHRLAMEEGDYERDDAEDET